MCACVFLCVRESVSVCVREREGAGGGVFFFLF